MRLDGTVAVVTGGGGEGSGRAIANRFACEGTAVVVVDVSDEAAQKMASAITAQGLRASAFRADVGSEAEVRALFSFVEEKYGGVDFIVNNASALVYPEKSLDDWFANLQVDLLGAMYVTRYGIEALQRRGGGAIVNISSTSALAHGDARSHGTGSSGYNTAKAAILRLTTTLGWMGDKEGIRVNCLVPHWIGTDHIKAAIAGMTPHERREWDVPDVLISPTEIAGAVLRLVTDKSLAGRVLVWYGGRSPELIPFADPGYFALEVLSEKSSD